MARSSLMDRSLAFTSLLNLSEAFRQMTTDEGSAVISRLVEDWRQNTTETDFHAFTKQWLETHTLDAPPVLHPISAREAAVMLGVHHNTIRNWCRSGYLKHSVSPSGKIRLWREDIVDHLRQMADQPTRQVD